MEIIVIDNGTRLVTSKKTHLWEGLFSEARMNGEIITFMECFLKSLHYETLFILPITDGNVRRKHIMKYIVEAKEKNKILIVGTLGQVEEDPDINYLYMPLDDTFFKDGIDDFFKNKRFEWKNRIPIAFWRGGCSGSCSSECGGFCTNECSGGGFNSIRVKTVGHLLDFPHADVKMNYFWNKIEKKIPIEYFGDCSYYGNFLKYKIFLIIDGNVIASNHMWGFASGAVPFMISNASCWFTRFLEPYKNYIPIQYDLSNLKEQIEWVIQNDEAAENIAKNAVEFSKKIFSSEFQKNYLVNEISRIVSSSSLPEIK